MEIIDVSEHDEINISIERLLSNGEISLDSRIEKRGYFNVALSAGRISLKTTRFVGLIPLTPDIAIRVAPKTGISNLAMMMVRAGNIPAVIEDFSRGYLPSFSPNANCIATYYSSLISTVTRLLSIGIMKDYVLIEPAPSWRGRLLVTETVKREIAHGVRYRKSFDFRTFSPNIPQNKAIKLALLSVLTWLQQSQDKKLRAKTSIVLNQLKHFDNVSVPSGPDAALVLSMPKLANSLPPQYRHYSEALWAAYVILQGLLPDPTRYGYMSLDSMVVDISAMFEGYVRNVLLDHPEMSGVVVKDGNSTLNKCSFFLDPQDRVMKPDIIFERAGKVVAIADVKYKHAVNEHDRYELLSFMEATGASEGIFICPKTAATEESVRLGTTLSGKRMSVLRFDLAVTDMISEEHKFAKAVCQVINGASL